MRNFRFLRPFCPLTAFGATLCTLTAPSPVGAQDMVRDAAGVSRVVITGQSPDEELPVLESSTATRIPGERILDTPRSVSVINQRTLQDQLITDPQDAVRNVPGVLRTASFTGVGENYQLRGFIQQDILKDGFRAGQVANGGINATGPTDIANLDRIEVLRGPTAILYGRGEPGGLVNYVTKTPFFANQFTLEQQVGSYDFYRTQLGANWQAVPGTLALRVDAAYERNESFVDFVKGERYFVAPGALWQIGRDTLLTLRGEYSHDHRANNVGLPVVNGKLVPNVPYSRYFGEPGFTDFTLEEFRGLLTLEHRWDDANRTTLSVHGRHAEGEGPYFILFNFAGPTFDPVTGNVSRGVAITDTDDTNLTARVDHVWDWTIYERAGGGAARVASGKDKDVPAPRPPAFAIKNQLLLSAEYERQVNDPLRVLGAQAPLNAFNPQYNGYAPLPLLPFPGFPLKFDEKSHTEADAYSLLLQDRVSFGETLYLSFGGRVEYFDANQTFTYPATVPFPSSSNEQDPVTFNPSAGLVVKPARNLSLYGSYAESTNSFINLGRATVSGASLDPERARQFELGAKAELLDRRLLVSTAVFQINKSDVAGTDPANPLFSVNAGDERSRGVEFELTGEPLPGWRLSLAYAYVDAKITRDPLGTNVGNRRFGVPENSGSFFTTYEFPTGTPLAGFGFGGGVFLADRVQIDNANTGQLSGYAQTDLVAFYRRKNYRAQVNLKNAFDNEYFFTQGDGATVQPATARTLVGSVSVSF